MDRSDVEADPNGLQTLDVDALRALRLQRHARFRASGEPFEYEVRLLGQADSDALLELHEEIIDSLPEPLLLYRRDAGFFHRCISGGCVAGAFHGPALIAYAALFAPGNGDTNYGEDLGLPGADLRAVGHLAGSAVAPPYRGNRLQRELVALRNCFAVRSGRHHQCGEVVPTNVISIINHLAKGFYLKGHRIDDFGDRCYILHSDLRHGPTRAPGDTAVEAPIREVDRYVELVEGGRWGFEVVKREDDYHLRFGRFD